MPGRAFYPSFSPCVPHFLLPLTHILSWWWESSGPLRAVIVGDASPQSSLTAVSLRITWYCWKLRFPGLHQDSWFHYLRSKPTNLYFIFTSDLIQRQVCFFNKQALQKSRRWNVRHHTLALQDRSQILLAPWENCGRVNTNVTNCKATNVSAIVLLPELITKPAQFHQVELCCAGSSCWRGIWGKGSKKKKSLENLVETQWSYTYA